ncbi:MAG: hypothetical protein KF764_20220 [Labilithrix sp.]|nr:hypothetical protein [Labilithrix sp.]
MLPKGSARGRVVLVVLGLAIAACGPTSRAASTASAERQAPDAGAAEKEESDEEGNDDGDPATAGDADATEDEEEAAPCPSNMVLVAAAELRFCIDTYEASLVEVDSDGNEKAFPHWLPVDGRSVRAVSQPDVFPQGFISEVQAEDACAASGKRLCSHGEWKTACMGPAKTTFPYGDTRRPGACHDTGKSAVGAVFGARALADPVARAPSKPATAGGTKGSTPTARGTSKPGATASTAKTAKPAGGAKAGAAAGTAKVTKPGRQPHATKGRAAVTTKPRAARPGKATTRAEAPARKKPGKREAGDARGNASARDKNAPRATARVPAKTSARPASVEPSVWTQLNDPRLGQVDGALSKTGSHEACVNEYGAFDLVGNLHEWVKTDPSAAHGTFAGGYYLDTSLNGDGCGYRTTAHAHDYHDYSTGFRCCADAPAPPATPITQD